jgi:plasmid maintenance system antidote protein VapI
MQSAVAQRIKNFIDSSKWTINSLSKVINVPQMTLNRQISGVSSISIDTICALLTAFPTLSAEWLLRGIGQMESSEPTQDAELKAVCVEQAKEIYHLKQRLAELEKEKRDRA